MNAGDMSQLSLLDLFRLEVESQARVLTAGLLMLERDPALADRLEVCMRAAHSLKGAARIVELPVCVDITHAMEDCFVAAQQGRLRLGQHTIDVLLEGVDLLSRIAQAPEQELAQWRAGRHGEADAFLAHLAAAQSAAAVPQGEPVAPAALPAPAPVSVAASGATAVAPADTHSPARDTDSAGDDAERVLRVTASSLDRLLGLAGETLVESRWLSTFTGTLLELKRLCRDSDRALETLQQALPAALAAERAGRALGDARRHLAAGQELLRRRQLELETFSRRNTDIAQQLYDEALASRMRPLADGVQALPRLVRDLARSLGKQARLDIAGLDVPVDRDILEKLDAPLGHLMRNAVDHGIEMPEARQAAGKPAEGVVRLEAWHAGGVLHVAVQDDGAGIAPERLRAAIVARRLADAGTAARMSDAELLEFLFLPGFSLREAVTTISGRGVGLDAVQEMVRQVRGTVRVVSQPGQCTRFLLQLPLTLSVIRALVACIDDEAYAFPLASIVRTLRLRREDIRLVEGRQHFDLDGRMVGLVMAQQVLEHGQPISAGETLPVVVIGEGSQLYGLAVDSFVGQRELVVQPLDPRLGKIRDISAGALLEDGSPVLIVDIDDLVRSLEKLVASGLLNRVGQGAAAAGVQQRKRVLVVDDSLTVRELERKLLAAAGYEVEVAVDGMDGWNAVREGDFDLVITDIDMPRMDGIELVSMIRRDARLKSLLVMVVSYKDREEDRQRGLEAGADYYLTKGSFHDEALLQAVVDLVGAA
ncbi:MAG: chemotaxis protein CheA [Moraxellaceae bacterium]|jgi:two-component system sensor histidine kinase and response regulator WspE|nr:chemotaxis protein CheA [Moraxellaceae bacterium]